MPRSAENLRVVIALLDVEHAPQYQPNQPQPGMTHCNGYVRDLLKALEVPFPHDDWYAHQQLDYLFGNDGHAAGWSECDPGEAGAFANQGYPVVVGYRNLKVPPEGHSHIAQVRPNGSTLSPHITQAGAHNYLDAPLALGFGHLAVRFTWHL